MNGSSSVDPSVTCSIDAQGRVDELDRGAPDGQVLFAGDHVFTSDNDDNDRED